MKIGRRPADMVDVRLFALTVVVCLGLQAAPPRITGAHTGLAAQDRACALSRLSSSIDASAEQVFFRFLAAGLGPGDRLRIDWINPQGAVSTSAAYDELPAARELCFLSALPVGGFEPATQPGAWRVRVSVNGAQAHETAFQITGAASPLSAKVVEVGEKELVLDAFGATSETSVNLARYTPSGGWTYILTALAETQDGRRLRVAAPKLDPGEYLVILRSPDGTQSPPARFVISTGGGYQMPTLATERWRISQRPYGSYSHWGRSLHAYDIAPVDARYVTAMRAGTVEARDLGYGQTPHLRIFGNYISIRHDDGEFSHYAHLRTGSFRVRSGQRVEAGAVLAEVGNSGYSFGRHVHVHVTRAPSISAQSIPFKFSEPARGDIITRRAAPPKQPEKPRWRGHAPFADWWTRLLPVPAGARRLSVRLGWDGKGDAYDLYLVSPSGQTFRPETGAVDLPAPEPGQWRVSVQSIKDGSTGAGFWVEPEVTPGRQ